MTNQTAVQPANETAKPVRTYTFNGRKTAWAEYRVLCYVNGKRHPEGDYFTDDKADAEGTLAFMQANANR